MSNIIRTVPNAQAGTGATYRNTGDQNGRGLELESVYNPGAALRLMANYSLQRSTDKATGLAAGYAPRHHLYARADLQLGGGWQFGPQINRVAGRARAPGDLRAPMANYTTLDLNLRAEPARSGWAYAASIRNLFNADVREPSPAPGLQLPHDLPMAPRALAIELIYRM